MIAFFALGLVLGFALGIIAAYWMDGPPPVNPWDDEVAS